MLTLCMDTAYKYLALALIEDDKIIASSEEICFKKQSETIFIRLEELFKEANINPLDIDSICITEGPGSYTGVRIAMSVAKTICDISNKDLYTISTLRLYAANKKKTMVILDARANRAYVGIYDEDNIIKEDEVMELKDIDINGYNLVGDLSLFGIEDYMPNLAEAFRATKKSWKKVDNIAYLVPKYLKKSEEYLK